ncbi:hypothetical protein [Lysobacter sp. CA196]|uniref:hypothetical protein n=1 Tax=Lysobacter sp. CA196 TaxID=3455606 RepID=UPI003F8D626A
MDDPTCPPPPDDEAYRSADARRGAIWLGLPIGLTLLISLIGLLLGSSFTQPVAELRWLFLQLLLLAMVLPVAFVAACINRSWATTLGSAFTGVMISIVLAIGLFWLTGVVEDEVREWHLEAQADEYRPLAAAVKRGDRAAVARAYADLQALPPPAALCRLATQAAGKDYLSSRLHSEAPDLSLPQLMFAAEVLAAAPAPRQDRQTALVALLSVLNKRDAFDQFPRWLQLWRMTLEDPASTRIEWRRLSKQDQRAYFPNNAACFDGTLTMGLFGHWGHSTLEPLRDAGFRLSDTQLRDQLNSVGSAKSLALLLAVSEHPRPLADDGVWPATQLLAHLAAVSFSNNLNDAPETSIDLARTLIAAGARLDKPDAYGRNACAAFERTEALYQRMQVHPLPGHMPDRPERIVAVGQMRAVLCPGAPAKI